MSGDGARRQNGDKCAMGGLECREQVAKSRRHGLASRTEMQPAPRIKGLLFGIGSDAPTLRPGGTRARIRPRGDQLFSACGFARLVRSVLHDLAGVSLPRAADRHLEGSSPKSAEHVGELETKGQLRWQQHSY
jgi:hypothetical protein